jgi:hypothetical protein
MIKTNKAGSPIPGKKLGAMPKKYLIAILWPL